MQGRGSQAPCFARHPSSPARALARRCTPDILRAQLRSMLAYTTVLFSLAVASADHPRRALQHCAVERTRTAGAKRWLPRHQRGRGRTVVAAVLAVERDGLAKGGLAVKVELVCRRAAAEARTGPPPPARRRFVALERRVPGARRPTRQRHAHARRARRRGQKREEGHGGRRTRRTWRTRTNCRWRRPRATAPHQQPSPAPWLVCRVRGLFARVRRQLSELQVRFVYYSFIFSKILISLDFGTTYRVRNCQLRPLSHRSPRHFHLPIAIALLEQ